MICRELIVLDFGKNQRVLWALGGSEPFFQKGRSFEPPTSFSRCQAFSTPMVYDQPITMVNGTTVIVSRNPPCGQRHALILNILSPSVSPPGSAL